VPKLGQKVKNALDETRILVLGTQVLLGFQYRGFMEPAFDKLPEHSKNLQMAGLFLLLAALGALLLPAARHRLVERGWDSTQFFYFTMNALYLALLPFAAALGLALFIGAERVMGTAAAAVAGFGCAAGAGFFWYALPHKLRRPMQPEEDRMSKPKLEERIQHVLTEARIVLPGAQAMLGFQLAMMLMDAFEKLSSKARMLHFVSLCFVALTTVLLMAPAAFHRVAERGHDTDRLERFASGMVLAALVTLAAGLALDLAVVTERWCGSLRLGLVLAAVVFVALMAGWFGLSLALRVAHGEPAPRGSAAEG
jgi:hypothetical protein